MVGFAAMLTPKRTLALLVGLLLTTTALRLYAIQRQSVWFDEGWSAYAAAQPTLLDAWNADATNPPLYYVLLNLFAQGAGQSTLALRGFSLLLGVVGVALAYRLGRTLFNQRAGLCAAFLCAVNPLLWWAAQEMRMYTLLAVLVLLAALGWHTLQRGSRHWTAWALVWGAELALLYAHNTGPVIAVWLNAVTLLNNLIPLLKTLIPQPLLPQGEGGQSGNVFLEVPRPEGEGYRVRVKPTPESSIWRGDKRGEVIPFRRWIGGQIVIGLLWLPYLAGRFALLTEANSALNNSSPFSLDLLARLWGALWTGVWAMVGREPLLVILSGVALLAALVLIAWRRAAARWLVLHTLLLVAGVWAGLGLLGNEIHGRYLVMIAPLLLVALGAGLARLRGIALAVGLALFGGIFAAALLPATTNPAYQHDDARGMTRYYAQTLTAADSVVMWSYADRYELAYYWPRESVTARRITLPEGADEAAIRPLLPTSGDVALNVWYTQRADYRGMMPCLLGDGTINEPESFSTYSMTNLLFRAPALRPLELNPATWQSDAVAVTAAGADRHAPADAAWCLPVEITLTQVVPVDLKVALRVTNASGWEIAGADAILADAAQRTTSLLPAGAVVRAYPLLRLPVGTPAGDYRVTLRLYDESAQPSGYDLHDAAGTVGRDVSLALWQAGAADWSAVTRSSGLPVQADVQAAPDMRLIAHNQTGGALRNGDGLRLALLWQGTGALPVLTLTDADGRWSVDVPPADNVGDGALRLDWRTARIPPDAPSGTARLLLPDGTTLAEYAVEQVPALFEPPPFAQAVGESISGVGTLVGYTLTGDPSDRTQPFGLTLLWQAAGATDTAYTVFVQLVSDDGRVLAQSDSPPAGGARPTTGWRESEYIEDAHRLTFHADASAGAARLIVGLYDPVSGARVAAGAADHLVLQAVTVR